MASLNGAAETENKIADKQTSTKKTEAMTLEAIAAAAAQNVDEDVSFIPDFASATGSGNAQMTEQAIAGVEMLREQG